MDEGPVTPAVVLQGMAVFALSEPASQPEEGAMFNLVAKPAVFTIVLVLAMLLFNGIALAAPSSVLSARTFTCPNTAADGSIPVAASTTDNYSAAELQAMADKQARFDAWLAGVQQRGLVGIEAIAKAPLSATVSTTLHLQAKSYWCGPGSVEIIDDRWGAVVSGSTETARQQLYADWMGTTTGGTDFTVVDNALNHYITASGVTYIYSSVSTATNVYDHVQYDVGVASPKYPLSADLNITAATNSNWLPYKFDHPGHIVCMDGYNYNTSSNTIRLQDTNDESHWHTGGGATSGHHSYPRLTLANGVLTSTDPVDRRAVIW
jgi:hypothetical protein